METKALLTNSDLAQRWQVHVATVHHMRYAGKAPKHISVGKHCLYRIEDVEEFERLHPPQPKARNNKNMLFPIPPELLEKSRKIRLKFLVARLHISISSLSTYLTRGHAPRHVIEALNGYFKDDV
jgi:hypothetical protein